VTRDISFSVNIEFKETLPDIKDQYQEGEEIQINACEKKKGVKGFIAEF
jgi:hypothetical protein